jgi:phosphatidylserine/phosphatidylglycerophosphate/cardiolipin synthase-like enzyme
MKKSLLLTFVVFIFSLSYSQTLSLPDIEIVESIPIETSLDNPDIRNTQEVWLEMIGGAHKTIDIEQFYISNEPGKKLQDVLVAICKAADRGVKIRILVDARMYKTYPESVDTLGRRYNIETRRINYAKLTGGIQHAKYFIIDGQEVFVGSQNFDWRALEHIHELGLRINNKSIASAFKDIFDFDWQLSSDTALTKSGFNSFSKKSLANVLLVHQSGDSSFITPTCSPIGFIPDSALWDETAIVRLIDGAKSTLSLQFLAYSPFERHGEMYTVIDDAIWRGAKRGVKIKMLVSDWMKGLPAVKALKEMSAVPNIEVAFTSIPEWSGGYIPFARVEHCKYILADETMFWLGTANCEKNYYYSSRNLGITGTSSTVAGKLSQIFQKSWYSPYRKSIAPTGEYKSREHGERK